MVNDLSELSDAELRELRQWITEKRDHYQRFLAKIDRLTGKQRQTEIALSPSGEGKDSTRDKIVAVMREANKWLGNKEIRRLLEQKLGLSLSSNGLRAHLSKGDGLIFRRRGDGKFTKWNVREVEQGKTE